MKIAFKHRNGAMSLMDVMIVIATLVLMVSFLFVYLSRTRRVGVRISCVNNLKQVGLSYRIWAGDNNDKYPMHVSTNAGGSMEFAESPEAFRHFQMLQNELGTPKVVVCPEDEDRMPSINFSDFNNFNLSYFVGIDADETNATMLLSGDRHITNGFAPKNGMLILTTNQNVRWSKELHAGKNNVGLADGGVQQVSSKLLRKEILAKTGFETNRILLP